MNHKLNLDIKKLELPLPVVHEGAGAEGELGEQGNNLKKIIQ